jgi:hypothetical protein
MTISDEMICAAYDSLRVHQFEADTEFDDIIDCYVPVETRIDIINKDQVAWNNYMAARQSFEQQLYGHMFLKHVYRRATNNLKWRKLWLLKNDYKFYGIGPDGYHDKFLPLYCSDEKLLEFDYYKEIVLSGNHRH